jgi:hypothetical protein
MLHDLPFRLKENVIFIGPKFFSDDKSSDVGVHKMGSKSKDFPFVVIGHLSPVDTDEPPPPGLSIPLSDKNQKQNNKQQVETFPD